MTVYEYRAVGQDHPGSPEYCTWRLRVDAEEDAQVLLDADPPYDEVWIERREVVPSPPTERVQTLLAPASQDKQERQEADRG